jgi:Zn-dependent protease
MESLTALVAVSLIVAVTFLLPWILDGVRIPRWLAPAGLALNAAILIASMIRRRRTPR